MQLEVCFVCKKKKSLTNPVDFSCLSPIFCATPMISILSSLELWWSQFESLYKIFKQTFWSILTKSEVTDNNNGGEADVTEGETEAEVWQRQRGCQKAARWRDRQWHWKTRERPKDLYQRKEDKSQADWCWRLHRDIGETSRHLQRYVRVLLMLPLSFCCHRDEKAGLCPTAGD